MNQDEMRASIKAERDAMRDPEEVIADETTITIYGIRYSRELFRVLAFGPIGTVLRVEKRDGDTVHLKQILLAEQATA